MTDSLTAPASTGSTAAPALDGPPPLLPGPIPYELRIGVTGHREPLDRTAVDAAVRHLLRHIVDVLEGASASPFGVYGSPQRRVDRIDRALTECLGVITQILGPLLNVVTRIVASPLRMFQFSPARDYWPPVPRPSRTVDPTKRTPLKLTVISSLAMGADQIVARAVCDFVRRPEQRNRYLEAVLPFPRDVYQEEFDDRDALDAFCMLMALDKGHWNTHPNPTVMFPDFPASPDPDDPRQTLPRHKAYAAAGRQVVEMSEIVIAIWDPSREEGAGGTGETARYAVDRGRLVLWLNPANLAAGAFVLRSAASGNDEGVVDGAIGAPPGLRVAPLPATAKQLSPNFHRLAAYNRDAAIDDKTLETTTRSHVEATRAIAERCHLPQPAIDSITESLLPHVLRADHVSVRYQALRDSAAWLWPVAAAFVVSLMAFQIIFLPDAYWLAFVELMVLLLGYASHRVSVYDAWHEKWLNDRRLAEGLRAAMFTSLVVGDEDVMHGNRRDLHILDRHHEALPFYNPAHAWFVGTLKRVLRKERRRFAPSIDLGRRDHCRAVASFLAAAWIRPQAEYHARRAARHGKVTRVSGKLRLALILAMAFVAVLHAVGFGHGAEAHTGSRMGALDLWVAFLTIVLPAWTAAFHVVLALDDHERMEERAAHMARLLGMLATSLDQVDNAAELRECVADAERLMDLESEEWAASLIARKPEFTG